MSQPPPVRSLIYGDDSSKSDGDYFAYGSILFNEARLAGIEKRLKAALGTFDHEIKWNEARFLTTNVKFVGALFDAWPSWSYRCIVVPHRQIKKAASGSKARALLRAKLVFTHLNTYVRKSLVDQPRFFATLDKDEFDPDVQAITLNRRFWKDHGGEKGFEAFEVRGEHSHDHLLLQAADLITGAVAWVSNGGLKTKSKAYEHRYTLASLIAKRARLPALEVDGKIIPQADVRLLGHQTQQWNEKGFSIWHVDLAKSRSADWQL